MSIPSVPIDVAQPGTGTPPKNPPPTPITAVLVGALVTAAQAVASSIPADGRINWPVAVATFIVAAVATFLVAEWHLAVPSATQAQAITLLVGVITGLTTHLQAVRPATLAVPGGSPGPATTPPEPPARAVTLPVGR